MPLDMFVVKNTTVKNNRFLLLLIQKWEENSPHFCAIR